MLGLPASSHAPSSLLLVDCTPCRDEASLASVQRGMLRHTFLVLDHSRAMDINDFKPTRAAAVAQVAKVSAGHANWLPALPAAAC